MYLHKGNCNTTVVSVGTLCHRIISYLHIPPEAYNYWSRSMSSTVNLAFVWPL